MSKALPSSEQRPCIVNRPRFTILLFIGLLTSPLFGADAGVSTPDSIEPFFETHCYDCHDAGTAKADLNLEDLTRSIADSADALNWQDILDQLNAGEMPPKDKPQPVARLPFADLTGASMKRRSRI